MTRFNIALAGIALAMLTASQASATPTVQLDGPNRAVVGYQDLDLQSAKGRKALVNRIRVAANMVCTDQTDLRPLVDDQCYRMALANGTSQMNDLVTL